MEKEKIIFLDIDGVLNNNNYPTDISSTFTRDFYWQPYSDFCPNNVKNLNKILRETKAKIVISSSWRIGRTIDELREMLINGGVDSSLLSIVGKISDPKKLSRSHYIVQWLKENNYQDNLFIVIDDLEDTWSGPAFVCTNENVGLTAHDADKAIQFLNKNL